MQPRWDEAIAAQGIPLKVRRDKSDSFVEPEGMVARMEELGIATLLLPSAEAAVDAAITDYERFASPPSVVADYAARYPDRFRGLVTINPSSGMAGVEQAGALAASPWVVGLHLHTHSWDRPFDHRDFYPFYALAADLDLPVVVQAGTSGGRMASECGRPIGIDRAALYFENLRFVLSHTGWPWGDEALAMAQKHPNVFLGTAAYPPRHWSPSLIEFIRGAGRGKVLLGTSFPAVGHRHALQQLAELDLSPDAHAALLAGSALRVFTRLVEAAS